MFLISKSRHVAHDGSSGISQGSRAPSSFLVLLGETISIGAVIFRKYS